MVIVKVSEEGNQVVGRIKESFPKADIIGVKEVGEMMERKAYDAYIFVSAMGICVRTIAPFIEDKRTDPAIICVDSMGRNAISVLSGHIGGANNLTKEVARSIGANAIITTLSDSKGTWSLDTMAERFSWTIISRGRNEVGNRGINKQISLFVSGTPTCLVLDIRDKGTEWMETNLPENVTIVRDIKEADPKRFGLLITVSPFEHEDIGIPEIQYIPKCVCLGVGLSHQAGPSDQIVREIRESLSENNIRWESISDIATIEAKRDEPALKALADETSAPITLYSAQELEGIDVPTPSLVVEKHMGTKSVSEAASILRAQGGLILRKQKGANWTLAASIPERFRREEIVEFVGAGPGDPQLISLRGRDLLRRADLILYAGSLVPKQMVEEAKQGALVRSSASMSLEEQVELMSAFCQRGKMVVRLHTGDPCLYGAIQEQMGMLDKKGIPYRITPGISAFQAAAAELKSQFTIPEKTQTIILTRGEGRTKMPEKEQLHLLAKSGSTMCIYLSADIVESVENELLMEYPGETPVAVCYKLTWPEQKIIKGRLDELSQIVRSNGLRLDTLIVVGEAIGNREGLSRLYSSDFSHLFRKSKEKE